MPEPIEPGAPDTGEPAPRLDPALRAGIRRGAMLLALGAGLLFWINSLQGSGALEPGHPLGRVRAELGDGSVFRLKDERGHVVVLSFWATWCIPCRHEIPVLSRLRHEGKTVIGLAIDDLPLPALTQKAHQLGIDYPVGKGEPGLTDRLGIQAVPWTCVVGKDGAVAKVEHGAVEYDELSALVARAEQAR